MKPGLSTTAPTSAENLFSDDDLDAMLSGTAMGADDVQPGASIEARTLARTLAAQYAEVVAHHASDIVLGRNTKLAPRLKSVLADSRRLAFEMDDVELLDHYDLLEGIIRDTKGMLNTPMARQEQGQRLTDWVVGFADLVGGEVGIRLARDIVLRKHGSPLISHLREVRGLGERRLDRLYCAGLLTTEALIDADPQELSSVVGLPLGVAELVVVAARNFAEAQRKTSMQGLRQAVFQVARSLKDVRPSDPDFGKLLNGIKDTLSRLEKTIRDFEGDPDDRKS